MSEHQTDELAQARAFLLAEPGPAVTDEVAALRLLAQIESEADARLTLALEGTSPNPHQLAGYRRRRAYVWARLAQLRPEFEQTAADAVRAWREAEAAVIRAAVEPHTAHGALAAAATDPVGGHLAGDRDADVALEVSGNRR